MRVLILKPDGWPLPIEECPPGFFIFNDTKTVGFKSEYSAVKTEQVFNEAGEYASTKDLVTPVVPVWEEE